MHIQHFLKPAALALALASALAPVASAQAANFSFSGNITYQKDLVLIDFSVIAPSVVTLSTDSWQSGLNFDPLLTVFDGSQQLVIAVDDNDGSLPGVGFYDSVIGPTSMQAG
ncbi:MAG: DVUA0089 family protein, partial [Burkholderiales bacterium]